MAIQKDLVQRNSTISFAADVVERTSKIQRVPTGFLYPQDQKMTKDVFFKEGIVEHAHGQIRRVPTGYLHPAEEAKTVVSFDNETVEHTRGLIRRVPTGFLYDEDMPLEDHEDERKQDLELPATFARCNRALWRDAMPPIADVSDEHALWVDAYRGVRFALAVVDRPSSLQRVPTAFLRTWDITSEDESEMEMEVKPPASPHKLDFKCRQELLPTSSTWNQALWRDALPPTLTLAEVGHDFSPQDRTNKSVSFEETVSDRKSGITRIPTGFPPTDLFEEIDDHEA